MQNDEPTRRDFVASPLPQARRGKGSVRAAERATVEKNVLITTGGRNVMRRSSRRQKGRIPPSSSGPMRWPASVVREMAETPRRRGYSVLVPNPFYRVSRAPQFEDASAFSFGDTHSAPLTPLMDRSAANAAEIDAVAFVRWLTSSVRWTRPESRHARATAWAAPSSSERVALPNRVGTGAFHGGQGSSTRRTPASAAPKIGRACIWHRDQRRATQLDENEAEGSVRRVPD